ncbi:MAG: iron complex outermembrane receptor protein [Candidatus Azotimanducaceae bacterium]|jgi:iron complex outermembrane receptor protein
MQTIIKSLAVAIGLLANASTVYAQDADEDVVELDTFVTETEVTDDLGILQTEPVDSVFGFGKTILETPRAVTSINIELLEQFNAKGINDLVSFVPGTFTTSFFGVAGSLDIRGTSAENFFRGVKRLNNEGNYPTPIGASNRVDIIRGPMSPISGPSKVGGALNFIPKSARAETGQYLKESTGEISYTTGSWGKSILTAEVGGPTEFMGNSAGYYVYGELEASDSYYKNDATDQTLIQTSFNIDLDSGWRLEFGGMYQDWRGFENGGWNRVTQDLVDNGTYITGQPATNIDTQFGNGDGLIQGVEVDAWEGSLAGLASTGVPFAEGETTCFTGMSAFCFSGNFGPLDASKITQDLAVQLGIGLDPATVGTAQLSTSQVLITDRDKFETEVYTFYFDAMRSLGGGWDFTGKLFYDAIEYHNIDSYGFTKLADSSVIEGQAIFSKTFEFGSGTIAVQVSPSVRYTDASYVNDFADEVFDRTDLTVGFNALSIQDLPTLEDGNVETWTVYADSQYTQYGFAAMTDINLFENFNAVLGVRYDYVDAEGQSGDGLENAGDVEVTCFADVCEFEADDTDTGVTWSASVSYTLPGNFTPYVTMSEQTTIVSGAAAEIATGNIAGGTFLGDSELTEFGVKTSLLDGRLFAAVAIYEQSRIDFNSQNPVSNQPTESEGIEFELRYVPFENLSLIGTYSDSETRVLTSSGVAFSYIGAVDVPLVDPASIFGAIIGGNHAVGTDPLRGALPEKIFSVSASYRWSDNLTTSLSITDVDETNPSVLGGLVLPDYTLVNLSAVYSTEKYSAGLFINNLTDETYFRGNFPSLYGNNAILPELPRAWRAEFSYKF